MLKLGKVKVISKGFSRKTDILSAYHEKSDASGGRFVGLRVRGRVFISRTSSGQVSELYIRIESVFRVSSVRGDDRVSRNVGWGDGFDR